MWSHETKAAKKLHLAEVPCIVADDLDDEQIKAFRLADNKVAEKAEWDFGFLDKELSGIFNFNHPSGGAFSKADMSTTAQTGARGIVASGRYGDYIFIKTQKFDAVGFQKSTRKRKDDRKRLQ